MRFGRRDVGGQGGESRRQPRRCFAQPPEIDGKIALQADLGKSPALPEAGEPLNIDRGEYKMVDRS